MSTTVTALQRHGWKSYLAAENKLALRRSTNSNSDKMPPQKPQLPVSQEWLNRIATWFLIFMLGVLAGYTWHSAQISSSAQPTTSSSYRSK